MQRHFNLPEPILSSAKIIWDYMHVNQPLEKCDIAVAMGSHDLRVAAYAAQLVLDGWANLLVCSGASGRLTRGTWTESEAFHFAQEAQQAGLSPDQVILEARSTNTGENLTFTAEKLKNAGIGFESALLIHKPYMERRVLATAMKIWPHVKVVVASPPIPFQDYPSPEIPLIQVINIMVGDFQRIIEYPKKGYALEQKISREAMSAFKKLVKEGFNEHLV